MITNRASAIDVMELASASTPAASQVGAVLMIAPVGELELDTVRGVVAERIAGIARLRQRLQGVPLGCGRPIWVDDPSFDIANHVSETVCPSPGDRDAIFSVVAEVVSRPLSRERPMWSATLITGLNEDAVALVLMFHHVMADGLGGLAVLADLVDGAPPRPMPASSRSAPGTRALLGDAIRVRARAVVHIGGGVRRLFEAATELGTGSRTRLAPRCSLNGPVGPDRCLSVARTNLHGIHAAARRHGATVNDAAVTAITAALGRFLRERDENVDHLVLSIPVSGRTAATARRLGNQVGVMLVDVSVGTGTPGERVESVAAATGDRKQGASGAPAALLAPAFRVLAALRLLDWLTRHQRLVTTFVTNLRGPEQHVALLGSTVTEIIPVNAVSGNVRVAFGVFSYAGALNVTVVADSGFADDLAHLVALLETELDGISALTDGCED